MTQKDFQEYFLARKYLLNSPLCLHTFSAMIAGRNFDSEAEWVKSLNIDLCLLA
jgi:hypothetical protein